MSSEMTAPWNDMANGEFLWRDSNKHCAKNGYVLCGWPAVDMFPGSIKSDGAYSAHKNLGKGGGRQVITKFIGDRLSSPRKASNMVGLQYYEIGAFSYALLHILTAAADALTVTKGGIIVETVSATEAELEGSKPLSAYPQLDRPVLVSATGEVLVSYREIEAEEARRHRVIVSNAMEALKDEDEATEDERDAVENGDSTDGAIVPKFPALKFAEGRAQIVPTARAVVKGERMEQDTDDDDDEKEKGKGGGDTGKGKGKGKGKGTKKRSRKDAIISSDEDEDAEEMKGDHSSKRHKKSIKSDTPSS
jgi:hypothetical protein